MTNRISDIISYVRFPLCVCIVAIHVFLAIPPMTATGYGGGDLWLLTNHFLNGLIGEPFAVVIFFFISGFLFFRKGDFSKEDYSKKNHRRIKGLLFPFKYMTKI